MTNNRPSPAVNYIFTANVEEELPGDPPFEFDPEKVRFSCYQLEAAPTTGQLHYQGYIQMLKKCRFAGVLKALGIPAHIEVAKGTLAENKAYCSKRDSAIMGPWIFGEAITKGQRTDLEDACATLKEGGYKRVAEEHPTAFVKYHKGFRELERALRVVPAQTEVELRDWQKKVVDMVALPADDRKIIWVHDSVGEHGKSFLNKYLITNMGAVVLSGRVTDMAYAYDCQKIVVFDMSRTQADMMDHIYDFAEKLKNGYLFSSKYESEQKVFPPPHVIIMANVMPKANVWSKDRLVLINLDEC